LQKGMSSLAESQAVSGKLVFVKNIASSRRKWIGVVRLGKKFVGRGKHKKSAYSLARARKATREVEGWDTETSYFFSRKGAHFGWGRARGERCTKR